MTLAMPPCRPRFQSLSASSSLVVLLSLITLTTTLLLLLPRSYGFGLTSTTNPTAITRIHTPSKNHDGSYCRTARRNHPFTISVASSVAASSSSLRYAEDPITANEAAAAAVVETPDKDEAVVDVQIERPTMNSRRIIGTTRIENRNTADNVAVTMEDVWSIITDYDRLAIHVPNLKESTIVSAPTSKQQPQRRGSESGGTPGDGSYQCQLYQVGAQKIIGFDFSASVTLEMTEQCFPSDPSLKRIKFTCVDSPFFSVFDGAWTIQEVGKSLVIAYDVLVKPKGPVPVAALEWRIREDVPSNVRAVQQAATRFAVARAASAASSTPAITARKTRNNNNQQLNTVVTTAARLATQSVKTRLVQQATRKMQQLKSTQEDWERGETMAKYLE